MTFFDRLSPLQPYALAALRIITALLFIEHGTMKLFGFPAAMGGGSLPPLLLVAALLETIGGVLLLIGFLTRPVAFLLSGEMAVAYFMAHAPKGFYPAMNGGEGAILFCFIFLFLVFAGAGALSLDSRLSATRR
ncbi:DoxX family protein [Radicibacter daui]|uniref:DoxX family protein n=1 Tax=Radicibacter daui TaxID=3064829 RepID=UPI004046B982